jgi:hypothetical protein
MPLPRLRHFSARWCASLTGPEGFCHPRGQGHSLPQLPRFLVVGAATGDQSPRAAENDRTQAAVHVIATLDARPSGRRAWRAHALGIAIVYRKGTTFRMCGLEGVCGDSRFGGGRVVGNLEHRWNRQIRIDQTSYIESLHVRFLISVSMVPSRARAGTDDG